MSSDYNRTNESTEFNRECWTIFMGNILSCRVAFSCCNSRPLLCKFNPCSMEFCVLGENLPLRIYDIRRPIDCLRGKSFALRQFSALVDPSGCIHPQGQPFHPIPAFVPNLFTHYIVYIYGGNDNNFFSVPWEKSLYPPVFPARNASIQYYINFFPDLFLSAERQESWGIFHTRISNRNIFTSSCFTWNCGFRSSYTSFFCIFPWKHLSTVGNHWQAQFNPIFVRDLPSLTFSREKD